MDLPVSRLDMLRIHVIGTVVPTATCSVFQAGDFHGDCATITIIWRNSQVSRVTLLLVVWSHPEFRYPENERGKRSACPSLHRLNSESTFTRWRRDHGPNSLTCNLLLSERQGQRTSLKGELASSLTERQNVCH